MRYSQSEKMEIIRIGEEVATLLNELKKAGTYEVEFEPSGLSSGVYFYRLKAEDFVQSRKMVLLK